MIWRSRSTSPLDMVANRNIVGQWSCRPLSPDRPTRGPEDLLEGLGLGDDFELSGKALHCLRTTLEAGPVEEPGIAGSDPDDGRRIDPVPEEPETGICARLAGSEDHISVMAALESGEVVDGYEFDADRGWEGRRLVEGMYEPT